MNFCSVCPCQPLRGHCHAPKTELLHKCCQAMYLKEVKPNESAFLNKCVTESHSFKYGLDVLPDRVLEPQSFTELQGADMGVSRGRLQMPSPANFHSLIQKLCIPSRFHSSPPLDSLSALQMSYMRLKNNLGYLSVKTKIFCKGHHQNSLCGVFTICCHFLLS